MAPVKGAANGEAAASRQSLPIASRQQLVHTFDDRTARFAWRPVSTRQVRMA